MSKKIPITIGITGASGTIYGIRLLAILVAADIKVDLILSTSACQVAGYELDWQLQGLNLSELETELISSLALKACFHEPQENSILKKELEKKNLKEYINLWGEKNFAAAVSSGSYKTQGMIIAPSSMGTIANINAGTSNNLIARAADVCLKERRKLVLIARETPLSNIHLQNMLSLSQAGAIILPAAPGFYHKPESIQDQIDFVLGKTLDAFQSNNIYAENIDLELFKRWSA